MKTIASIGLVEMVVESITTTSTAQELCRKLAHLDIPGYAPLGVRLYFLDNAGQIRRVAHFGKAPEVGDSEVFLWDDHIVARAMRAKVLTYEAVNNNEAIAVLPFLKDSTPIGGIALLLPEASLIEDADEDVMRILSKLGTHYLESTGLTIQNDVRYVDSDDWRELTQRQLQVLSGMASGLTNAEIARELLLSESTIRQETVRIFKALGVPGRLEAGKKAKALGLLSK